MRRTRNKNKYKQIRIGTLNIQGGISKLKKTSIVADMETYKIMAITTTETKTYAQINIVQTLRTADGKVSYSHYLSGSKHHKEFV